MKNLQAIADKLAVSLSMLCAIHCLAMPLAIVMIPTLAGLPIAGEGFHLWMVFAVLPISIYALTKGCKKHSNYQVLSIGGLGLVVLIATAIFGHDFLGETAEKALTVLGASIIAVGHVWNYRLCQRHSECAPSE